jgi:hypothetical protein
MHPLNVTRSFDVRTKVVAVDFAAFILVYYIFFGRYFIHYGYQVAGDSGMILAINNLASYTIDHFGEFLWWDPTTLNGWPAFLNLSIGWYNYLSPYSIPSHLVVYVLTSWFGWMTADAVQVQLTLVTFGLNLLAVVLTSHLLFGSTVARLLPPLLLTIGQPALQMIGLSMHGAALVPANFFLLGCVVLGKRRDASSLLIFLTFSVLLVSSINYIFISSSFVVISVGFLVSLALLGFKWLYPRKIIVEILSDRLALIVTGLLALSLLLAVLNVLIPLKTHGQEIVRVGTIDTLVNYRDASVAALFSRDYGWNISYQHIITSLLQWMPYDDMYVYALADPDPMKNLHIPRMDVRYLGVLTIPLFFAAMLLVRNSRILAVIFGTMVITTLVLPYTVQLLPVVFVLDNIEFLRNIRHTAHVMPRDLPSILAIFVAAYGFHALLRSRFSLSSNKRAARGGAHVRNPGLKLSLKFFGSPYFALIIFLIGCLGGSALFLHGALDPEVALTKRSGAHIAIFLAIYSMLLLGLIYSRSYKTRTLLGCLVMVVAAGDLSISTSSNWNRGGIWIKGEKGELNATPEFFGALRPDGLNWIGSYSGIAHGLAGTMHFGMRTWLVLHSRPDWRPVLENWDPKTGLMTSYPEVRFATGGAFVDFKEIENIDALPKPAEVGTPFYVHDPALAAEGQGRPLAGSAKVVEFTPNRAVLDVAVDEPAVMMMLDNFDPFWKASVNGSPVDVHRANFTFKAIKVPAGASRVVFVFDPFPVKLGWGAFYVVFTAAVALLGIRSLGGRAVIIAFGGCATVASAIALTPVRTPLSVDLGREPRENLALSVDGASRRVVDAQGRKVTALGVDAVSPDGSGASSALRFGGSGYITVRKWDVDACLLRDCSIRFDFKLDEAPNRQQFLIGQSGTGGGWHVLLDPAQLIIQADLGGRQTNVPITVVPGRWHTLSIASSLAGLKVEFDGKLVATSRQRPFVSGYEDLYIGGRPGPSPLNFVGEMRNVRIDEKR